MIDHWMTNGLLGANASFQRAAREYAEEYAGLAVAEERERLRIQVLRAQIRCGTEKSGGMTIGSFNMAMLDAFKA